MEHTPRPAPTQNARASFAAGCVPPSPRGCGRSLGENETPSWPGEGGLNTAKRHFKRRSEGGLSFIHFQGAVARMMVAVAPTFSVVTPFRLAPRPARLAGAPMPPAAGPMRVAVLRVSCGVPLSDTAGTPTRVAKWVLSRCGTVARVGVRAGRGGAGGFCPQAHPHRAFAREKGASARAQGPEVTPPCPTTGQQRPSVRPHWPTVSPQCPNVWTQCPTFGQQ